MGPLGWQETVFIFVLALLLFGPKKLPELGKTIGKALTEFRRASNELKSTFDREMSNLEKETGVKEVVQEYNTEINKAVYDGSSYDYNYYDSGYDGYQPYETADSKSSTEGASATQGANSDTAQAKVETATVAAPEGTVPVSAPEGEPQPQAARG
ncbi:MAG: twin-arginine translocase TatA/TatE family subunit [Bryobacteraceae bacterium]|nr:twin-arginine translocase TatA/TatE family subunit [Bryobacteraceae bacterium]